MHCSTLNIDRKRTHTHTSRAKKEKYVQRQLDMNSAAAAMLNGKNVAEKMLMRKKRRMHRN